MPSIGTHNPPGPGGVVLWLGAGIVGVGRGVGGADVGSGECGVVAGGPDGSVVGGGVVVPADGAGGFLGCVPVVGARLLPPMADVAEGSAVGAVAAVAAVFAGWSVPPSLVLVPRRGSASAVPGEPAPGSGVTRTRLSTPAARARPPAASSTLRGRGLR